MLAKLQPQSTNESYYDKLIRSDAQMFAVGHWTWEKFNQEVDRHLRDEADDHARRTAVPA